MHGDEQSALNDGGDLLIAMTSVSVSNYMVFVNVVHGGILHRHKMIL